MAEEKNVMNEEVEETVEETVESTETEEVETSEEVVEETTEENEEEKPKKEGFFKKKKDKKDEQIEELNERVVRQMAEFDNFRKRSEKEKSMMFDMGAKHVVEKILPVVDNFERGFTTVEDADKDDAFVQGMQQVYKQLMTELEAIGVTPIEAVGQEFNPDFHNAVMQVESEEYESGVIAQEFQKDTLTEIP
jgi:molecular chaperone GrpE